MQRRDLGTIPSRWVWLRLCRCVTAQYLRQNAQRYRSRFALTTDARNRIQLTIGAGQSTFGGKRQLPGAITAICWGRR